MWRFHFRWAHWKFIYRLINTFYISLFEKLKSIVIKLTLLLCGRFALISYILNNTHRFDMVILFFICHINIITCFFITFLIIHRPRPILYLSNRLTLCMWNILFTLFYSNSLLWINSRHDWCWHSRHVITLIVANVWYY